MDIRIDVSQMIALGQRSQQAAASVHREINTAMTRSVTQVEADAKRIVPVVTHTLQRSITSTVSNGGLVGQVGTNVPYARYVEEGTGPHEIRPRNARVLAFKVGGKMIFAMSVQHPGSKGRFYMRRAFEQNQAAIQREFDQAAQRVIRTFGAH